MIYIYIYRDAPNAWAPHQYIALQALRALPSNITTTSIQSQQPSNQSSFDLIPSGQLGLNETQLPGQPVRSGGNSVVINSTTTGLAADINSVNGTTVINGGNSSSGENWSQTLQRELANRYFTSVLCSW
jgi:alpha,alpha-trehalase